MKSTDNRRRASHALSMIQELRDVIDKIDSGASVEDCFDKIENKTVKLGNAVKQLSQDFTKAIPKNVVDVLYGKLRCRFAHRNGSEDFNPQKDYNIWKKNFVSISSELEKCLTRLADTFSERPDKRRFENMSNLSDRQDDRKRIVDAMEDSFDTSVPEEDKLHYPQGADILKSLCDEFPTDYRDYLSLHEELSEDVQSEILKWSEEARDEVEYESLKYFAAEERFLINMSKMPPDALFNNIEQIEKSYNKLESVIDSSDIGIYYKSYLDDITKVPDNTGKEGRMSMIEKSYFQALIKTLYESFNARKAVFEQKLIDEKRKKFLEKLYKKIDNFKKLEDILQPFIDDLGHGYLWDMSNAPFRNLGFDILKKYSSLLKNDKALQEFAELLGSQSVTSQEVEKQMIEETIVKSEYHPQPAQRGNVIGFEYSNEISRVLPSETALLTDPDLENLFYLRFAEKQLLSYRYSQDIAFTYSQTQQKEIEVSKTKDLTGPIIICVDTSGSMQGTPEQTAKIATFALAKIAMRQRRKCYLISFSTGIETLDMSDFKKPDALETLVNFLNKSFNGGTDAAPALAECLRQLKTQNYKNADVLMISDFVMGSLPAQVVSSVELEKKNGTFFYSLVIGQSANNRAVECFDENISYNPYDEFSRQEFYKKIRQMATEKRNHRRVSQLQDVSRA